ncbi:MAG: WYL domain-containing protein [Dehalococcoidia bacterium]
MTEQTRRATRLVRIEQLLRKYPAGMTAAEVARATGYSTRTIQRDINALESELGVPIVVDHYRYQIMPGSFSLAPVRFTLQEARAIYLATRLYLKYADERDMDGVSALDKIADALPDPMAAHIHDTVEQLKLRPPGHQSEVLQTITEAWAAARTVHIRYRSSGAGGSMKETDLDPYLLEPSAIGAATYVVGHSHEHNMLRTFKIERIQKAEITNHAFVPGDVREIIEKMAASWGVVFGDERYDVVVEFSPAVAARIKETVWHPSQRLLDLEGGGVRLELKLPSTLEFVPWVRGWGQEAEVISPEELRREVARSLQEAARRYSA